MIYAFAQFEVDTDRLELRQVGVRVSLQPQAFDLLAYLVQHHDRAVTKDELVAHLWPEKFISDAALNTQVMSVRHALGDSGKSQRFIETLHRRGYRFIEPVRTGVAAPELVERTPPSAVDQRVSFCRAADGARIAYAVSGEGPPIVKAANWLTHLEYDWASPVWRHWLAELGYRRRLIRYDERGCGLSDWQADDCSFDAWVADLEAVADATTEAPFDLFGMSQGAGIAIAYAVRHPERVRRLVLWGAYARGWAKRNPSQREIEEREALLTLTREGWGRDNPAYRQIFASLFIPEATLEQVRWFNELCRASTSPETAVRFMREFAMVDVDDLLPRVSVPTLVVHARGDIRAPFEEGRRIASRISSAHFVPVESANHILLESEPAWHTFRNELRAFLA
jgi:pimeloyl-ACP methyl ester carboxylesterase/DNA-binding winged helix-turn-helix (wHTH) protein